MAIHAADSGVVHLAGNEGCVFVVLVANLSVRVVGVGAVGDGEAEMIVERFAGDEVARNFPTACVTGGAGVRHLIAGKFGSRGIFGFPLVLTVC